jgi:acyl-CoA synthetase (NDP forming)
VGEGLMAHSKFYINIILNIMKKLSKLFGLGGMYVEIIKDVRFGIAPLKFSEAIEMIEGIKGYNLLKGARGEKGDNIKKIDEIILRFSQMVNEIEEIEVIDLNPVFTYQKDEFVDVRIKIKEEK